LQNLTPMRGCCLHQKQSMKPTCRWTL
jgi:hypothetical protein